MMPREQAYAEHVNAENRRLADARDMIGIIKPEQLCRPVDQAISVG